jgi:Domain of unknown function (DUF1848)
MIISASRRTDIPSFYTQWFMNRIREGYCTVPNPFNKHQISRISLQPEDVDIIVFWTRNPSPLLTYLRELDERGYRYYFQYTIVNNPRILDPKSPSAKLAIENFKRLANLIGSQKVIWRYDPIVLSNVTDVDFHVSNYEMIASQLSSYTDRSVISILDDYAKTNLRLKVLEQKNEIQFFKWKNNTQNFAKLLTQIAKIAKSYNMKILSCAEEHDLQIYGIEPSKCIDDNYINKVFGREVNHKKDSAQREACGCVISKDIGMYDTCLFECQYCYATKSFDRARTNYLSHDPNSPSLLGWYDVKSPSSFKQLELF